MKPLVIYHHPCVDGWTAAWTVLLAFGDAELAPANYGQPPPDVSGRDVIILDFSYPRQTLIEMEKAAASLLVLDHHASAQKDLEGLPYAVFDMNRSGAAMAWEHFLPGTALPPLVQYVQDRDLWRWELPHSKEISAIIRTTPQTHREWSRLHRSLMGQGLADMVKRGEAILGHINYLVDQAVDRAEMLTFYHTDHVVPGVMCDPNIRSEVGAALLQAYPSAPFVVTLSEGPGGWTYSLRSEDSRVDVGAFAAGMKEASLSVISGGGHRNAAGCKSLTRLHFWEKP